MHYSNFRNIHTDSAHPMLKRIYSILETFQTTSEFPINIHYFNFREIHTDNAHPCYDESIQFWALFKQRVCFPF